MKIYGTKWIGYNVFLWLARSLFVNFLLELQHWGWT